jgi:proteasome lid subunit RPN8/RPN11
MFARLRSAARTWLSDIRRTFQRWQRQVKIADAGPVLESFAPLAQPKTSIDYRPLERVVLTDGVNRTLFDEYAAHRREEHGNQETGWVLLGHRTEDEAVVLATLPAGAHSDAGVAHVRFDSCAQAIASCMVRQTDRRLRPVGVVHTHPGTLRHPSDGDYQGDSAWVRCLRGHEGVFGIGTVGQGNHEPVHYAHQPRPNVQTLDEMMLSWYALRSGDATYRPLPVTLTLGPDLARPLHSVWHEIEEHAIELERLYRQQVGVSFDALQSAEKPGLSIAIPVVEPRGTIRVVIKDEICRYYLERDGDIFLADCAEERVDRGVYLLLAEMASDAVSASQRFC